MKLTLKATTFALILASWSSFTHAQTAVETSSEVTTVTSTGRHEYCLGPSGGLPPLPDRGPDDITLRFTLNERYENQLPGTVILPRFSRRVIGFTVEGQSGSTVLRDTRGGMNVDEVLAMPAPNDLFSILSVGKDQPVFDSLVGDTPSQRVGIPVLHRSSGLDLRGKVVQVVVTREYESLPPDVVDTLNETWAEYGTVWDGTVQSRVTIPIPMNPLTWDASCLSP
jgi:hypothetical protein